MSQWVKYPVPSKCPDWRQGSLSSSRMDLLNPMTWFRREESEEESWKTDERKIERLTWQQTRKMNSVIAVHKTFSLNWIFLSGLATSGNIPQKGLITSKNLTKSSGWKEWSYSTIRLNQRIIVSIYSLAMLLPGLADDEHGSWLKG